MSNLHNKNILDSRRKDLRFNQTIPELKLWTELRNSKLNSFKFKRQHSIGFYIVDFYCHKAKLIIEIDGDSHFTNNAKKYDQVRSDYFKAFDLNVLRFTNEEITNDLFEVLGKIKKYLPHLTSPCKGEE